jgi:hypothetical protein
MYRSFDSRHVIGRAVRPQVTLMGEYPCSFRTDGTCGEKGCLWGANTLLMGFKRKNP